MFRDTVGAAHAAAIKTATTTASIAALLLMGLFASTLTSERPGLRVRKQVPDDGHRHDEPE
jgi:hypothetical protein